jgi:hypothetical protein
MFGSFKYDTIPLKDIMLDVRNPRVVTASKLKWQEEILQYLFDHAGLLAFIKKIAEEGKNQGAERPYVVKDGATYTVIEGNSRIAAYKVLTGLMKAPKPYASSVPKVSAAIVKSLSSVDCSIAPNRDVLLKIMANAHFGVGDKSKWGYLGSRKAVYDEWKAGRTIPQLAGVFDRTEGQIRDLLIEYLLYLEALGLTWTKAEREVLQRPSVQFNPPVRFLQTQGHKEKLGITYGSPEPKIIFANAEAKKKYKHLVRRLVVAPTKGLGATASFDAVFQDYAKPKGSTSGAASGAPGTGTSAGGATSGTGTTGSSTGAGGGSGASSGGSPGGQSLKTGALFGYPVTVNNALITQLMKEGHDLNCKTFPAAGTFLLRNVIEALLKHIIYDQKANPASQTLDLEKSLNLCMSNAITLPSDDKKILKEFHKSHLGYLNLGAHGNVIPNYDRMISARDCIDQFIKRNV